MVNVESLANLRRTISFFATRGMAHTLTYGQWRAKALLRRSIAPSYRVDVSKELVQLDVLSHFRSRSTPVFFFNAGDLPTLIKQISIEEKKRTIQRADQICQNIFELRGVPPIRFQDSIDWNCTPDGNVDWRWDLNRHAFFETLGRAYQYSGDEKYASKFRETLVDWLDHNPARIVHPNWSSVFEVAFRINAWCWALYYFRQSSSFDDVLAQRLVGGLLTHGRYLNANIELHVPNNHLLLEAKALAFLGIFFPEFKEAKKWCERGLKIVEQQVMEQVCKDGVHGERTTLYHRIVAGELLELFVLMENNRIPISANLSERFARMIDFENALAKPDDTFPLLGDSAATDTHLRFSASRGGHVFLKTGASANLHESEYWLLGSRRLDAWQDHPTPKKIHRSAAFPDGGYYLMKSGQCSDAQYLIMDCGSFGLEAMPNHGHADALSFELYALGQTLLIDPGFYSTSLGLRWRNYFRGTRAHNTVVVDGVDQSHLMDARRVFKPARAKCLAWISNDEYDFVDGVHDGYEHLSQPVTHCRQIFFAKPRYWVINDILTGQGKHCFDVYFHMLPDASAMVNDESKTVRIENASGVGLLVVPYPNENWHVDTIIGATNPIQGWVSLFSGEKKPACVIGYHHEGITPVQFCTILYPYRVGEEPRVVVSRVDTDDLNRLALRIEASEQIDHVLIDRSGHEPTKIEFTHE